MPPEDIKYQVVGGKTMTLRPVEEDLQTFYTNNATFAYNEWDIRVELSELRGIVPGENPEEPITLVVRKARIVMAIGYAKRFATALLAQVKMYEDMEKQLGHEQPDLAPQITTEASKEKSS